MPAPPIELNRGPVTYTMTFIVLRGFRINATISQASHEADWVLSASTQLVDAGVVDANDQSFRKTSTETIPFNECQTLAGAEAKLQEMVDDVYDAIPTPAP